MKLSRTLKILIGLASAWPFLYIFLFIAFVFGMISLSTDAPGGGRELDPVFGGAFAILIVVHILTIFLSLGLTIFHIIHAVKNTKLDSNKRIMWILLFFFAGIITEPIYWYLEIWSEKPDGAFAGQINPPSASSYDFQGARSGTYVPPSGPPDWR